ncbi:Uncharacterised protein [uncultured archaeon]|nr:Uncharacterised protein [uncultured archaeon]
MGFEVGEAINFAFTGWMKSRAALKYFIVALILFIILNVALGSVAGSLFGSLSNAASMSPGEALGMVGYFFLYVAVFVVLYWLISGFIAYFMLGSALREIKRKPVEFSAGRYVRFLGLMIANCLSVVFSLFKLKFLWVLISGIVLAIVGGVLAAAGVSFGSNVAMIILGALLVVVAFILFICYAVIMVYNAMRLLIGEMIFVEKEQGIWKSLKASWDITGKNALNIFVVMFVVAIVVMILSFILSAPSMIYQFSVIGMTGGTGALKLMSDPTYLGLSALTNIVQAFAVMVQAFAIAGIYTQISKGAGAKKSAAKKTASRKRK